MEENLNKDLEIKEKLANLVKNNKKKLIIFTVFLITLIFCLVILNIFQEKKNNEISEKYIQAGINFNLGNKDVAKKIFEEVIISKNKFYSILALNIIIEKNLEKKVEQVLEYFNLIEGLSIDDDQRDLLLLKKALYLMDNSKKSEGETILKELINRKSKYSQIAEEVYSK